MDKLFAAFIIFSALWEILVPAKLIFLVHLEENLVLILHIVLVWLPHLLAV